MQQMPRHDISATDQPIETPIKHPTLKLTQQRITDAGT